VHSATGHTELTLAGGCAANSVANGKVRRMTPFKRVYVQSAAGDAGGAIGAAYAVWAELGGRRDFVMDHAFWGPQFAPREIADLIAERQGEIQALGCSIEEIANGTNFVVARQRRSLMATSSAGSRDVWSGARAPWVIARFSAIRDEPI
jgi:predicted NodU family carbamoyl transferase